jgi:hypothetical protein
MFIEKDFLEKKDALVKILQLKKCCGIGECIKESVSISKNQTRKGVKP